MTREEAAVAFAERLADKAPFTDDVAVWPMARLRVRAYAPAFDAPDTLITSLRAVVFRGSRVVVVREHGGSRHIVPGGRREPGETQEQTCRREVLEECGWHVGPLRPLALLHFQHLQEPAQGSIFPREDFVHIVHLAEGLRHERDAMDRTQIEAGSSLMSLSAARAALPDDQRLMLQAALALRRVR